MLQYSRYVKNLQHSSYDENVVELVKNLEVCVCPGLAEYLRLSALEEFCAILSLWEPQFHPLIREGHKNVLREIVRHFTYVENINFLQPLQPDLSDFPVHLQPCAMNYIDGENKMYHVAKEQARLHEKFDEHMASGALDRYICEGDALKSVLNDDFIRSQFSVLDHDLIKLSIQDKKCFSELVDKFDNQVFAGLHLPEYYVIRGIMDYRAMSLMKDGSCLWDHVFEKVVGEPYRRWIQNIPQFWLDTRYYDHQYYDIIQQPLQKFLLTQ